MHSLPRKPVVLRQTLLKTMMNQEVYHAFYQAMHRTRLVTKMLATVSILLRGIPFIYQGQEIGMQNAIWNSIDEFNDISTKDQYRIARDAGLTDREALAVCNRMSRDNARTPVQWSDQPNAALPAEPPG